VYICRIVQRCKVLPEMPCVLGPMLPNKLTCPRSFCGHGRCLYILAASSIVALVGVLSFVIIFPTFVSPPSMSSLLASSVTNLPNASIPSSQPHKLCILTRVRNTPRSLAEWLEYHHLLGVGHFFLVDDCSDDEGRTAWVLDTYHRLGLLSAYNASHVTQWGCKQSTSSIWKTMLARFWYKGRVHAGCEYTCGENRVPDEGQLFSFLYHQMLAYAGSGRSHGCEWTGVFDVDEYLTIQAQEDAGIDLLTFPASLPFALSRLLDARTQENLPIYRLPWVVMGSDGHEKRNPSEGLVIESSSQGSYEPWMLKTLARTDVIRDWQFSHWPMIREMRGDDHWQVPEPFKTLKEYVERLWSGADEGRTHFLHAMEDPSGTTPPGAGMEEIACSAPVSSLYLKHYFYRSYEEWEAHRGASFLKSDGGENTHFYHLRAKWEEGENPDVFRASCRNAYQHNFTVNIMTPLVRQTLAFRRRKWGERQDARGKDDGETNATAWRPFPPVEAWVL